MWELGAGSSLSPHARVHRCVHALVHVHRCTHVCVSECMCMHARSIIVLWGFLHRIFNIIEMMSLLIIDNDVRN